jgi:hypothetical protein
VNHVNFLKNCVTLTKVISIIFTLPKFYPFLKIDIMNTNITGYWNEKKEKLKQKFSTIHDDDLSFSYGKEKEMLEILGYKLGKTKDELRNILVTL